MMEFRREIMRHVYLTVLPASKFKTSCLSAQLVTELDREPGGLQRPFARGAEPGHHALSGHGGPVRCHGHPLRHHRHHHRA